MSNTEIVLQIPQEGMQKATVELADVRLMLVDFEMEAKRIKVETPEQYAEAGELLKRVRDAKKKASWIMNPLKSITRTIAEKFRTMEQAELNLAERIEGTLEPKMVDFKRREREAAAAEERRINEERQREAQRLAAEERKKAEEAAQIERKRREKEIEEQRKAGEVGKREAERLKKEELAREQIEKQRAKEAEQFAKENVQEVKVEPTTPKVAGLRQRIQWHWEVVDKDKIKRSFMIEDERAIGQFVRTAKDAKLAEETVGGIRVWSTDEI